MKIALVIPLILLAIAAARASENPTVDAVSAGRNCSDQGQQWTCEYQVGKSLKFAIVGIGQPDTGVTFFKADWDGDYYATYGLMHGCVIVKPGAKAPATAIPMFAFVSPKNGKVYPSWEMCQRGF